MSFADVLDATMGGPGVPLPPRESVSNRAITPPLFLFAAPGVQFRPVAPPVEPRFTARPIVARPPGTSSRAETTSAPRPQRATVVRRSLPADARHALDSLNALGAGLDDTLTAAEARRAFRRLARRDHPDRHPGCNDAERAALARRFAAVADHYRVLLSALNTHVAAGL